MTTLSWTAFSQSKGIHEVSFNECNGTLKVRFLVAQFSSCGACGLSIKNWREYSGSGNYIKINGVNAVEVGKSLSNSNSSVRYSPCGSGRRLYMKAHNGYNFTNKSGTGNLPENGGGCLGACKFNCIAFYAEVEIPIKKSDYGQSLNVTMSGSYGGNFTSTYSTVFTAPNFPEPTALQSEPVCGGVKLKWNRPTQQCNQTTIQIYRDGQHVADVASSASDYTDNVPYKASGYKYEIRSKVSIPGNTYYSDFLETTNTPIKVLSGINELELSQQGCATTQADIANLLTWTVNPIEKPDIYIIERSLSPDFSADLKQHQINAYAVQQFGSNQYKFTDDNSVWGELSFDTRYYYRVRGVDICGVSKLSNSLNIEIPGIPLKPENVKAELISPDQATITWDHFGGKFEEFQLYRKLKSGSFSLIATLDSSARSFTDIDLLNCSEYAYVVAVKSKCFNEQRSEEIPLPIALNPNLNQFQEFTASKGFYPDRVVLSWNYTGTSSVSKFIIYRRELAYSNAFQEVDHIDAPAENWSDKDIESGQLYEYAIIALDCDLYKNFRPEFETVYKATGFSSEFGVINGKVTFQEGNAVQNVRITALPSNDIAQGNSIDLKEGTFTTSLLDKQGNNWLPSDQWSMGFWINPRDTLSGQSLLSLGNSGQFRIGMGSQQDEQLILTESQTQESPVYDRTALVALAQDSGTYVFSKASDQSIFGQLYLPDSSLILYEQDVAYALLEDDTLYNTNGKPSFLLRGDSIFAFDKKQVVGPMPNQLAGYLATDTIFETDASEVPKLIIENGKVYQANVLMKNFELGAPYARFTGDTLRYVQDPSYYGVLRGDTIYNDKDEPYHLYLNKDLYYLSKIAPNKYVRGDRFATFDDDNITTRYIISSKKVVATKGAQIGIIDGAKSVIASHVNAEVLYQINEAGYVFSSEIRSHSVLDLGALRYLKKGPWIFSASEPELLVGYMADNNVFYTVEKTYTYDYDPASGYIKGTDGTVIYQVVQNPNYHDLELYSITQRMEDITVEVPYDTITKPRSQLGFQLPNGNSIDLKGIYLNEYNHLYLTYQGGQLKVFVNGLLKDSAQIDLSTIERSQLTFGPFDGLLDEVSIWSKAKDQMTVYKDFQRYLGSGEENLIAYWRINEGVGEAIYDASNHISQTGIQFNEHHGQLSGNVKWSNAVPVSEQLSYTSYTDQHGNYTIEAVAFSGTGQNYTVAPIFNKHQFAPSNTVLFIGKGALVNNNVNFEDLSSFLVTGLVQYDPMLLGYTDRNDPNIEGCGVEGAFFLIDGEPLFKDGNLLKTDRNGYFEIAVPIGEHTISVLKNNHTFSVGQWPNENPHDFQDDVIGLKFYDNTTRKIIGKVVGGVNEGGKFAGFGRTKNNLGVTKITFQSIGKDCVTETVYTDSLTGEYEVELLPLLYRVSELKRVNGTAQQNRELRTLTEGTIPLNSDTLLLQETAESEKFEDGALDNIVDYHYVKDFIYRKPAEIVVKSGNDDPTQFGARRINVKLPNSEESAIILVDSSSFAFPVFQQDNWYTWNIKVAEQYQNVDNGAWYSNDVTEGDFRVENNISQDYKMIKLEEQARDSLGFFQYPFQAGNPNITYNRKRPERSYTWDIQFFGPGHQAWLYKGDIFRGYVLGSIAESQSDFYTVKKEDDDPLQMVDFVLRDPPGSQSYAYIEKGTKLEFASKYETTNSNQFSEEIGIGIGFEKLLFLTLVAKEKSMVGFQYEQQWTDERSATSVRTVETQRRIETSKEPRNAGHQSDLFVGRGVNIFTPVTRNVAVIPEEKCKNGCLDEVVYPNGHSVPYRIGKYKSIAVYINTAEETEFAYTAVQIEQEVKALEKTIGDITDTTTAEYNRLRNQINIWKQVLGHNELQKLQAINSTDTRKNYSFGAGAKIEESYNLSNSNQNTENFNYKASGGGYLDVYFEMFATSRLRVDYKNVTTSSVSSSTNQTDNAKVGYVLEDKDVGDKLNVEVILSGKNGRDEDLENFDTWQSVLRTKMIVDFTFANALAPVRGAFGTADPDAFDSLQVNADDYFNDYMYDPVYVLKGGRTSCPHEEEFSPKYIAYVDSANTDTTKISRGSYQRDQPGLRIEPRILTGVPADQRAIFDVVFENYNDEDSTRYYEFILDQRTNGNGATLRLDGERFIKGTKIPMSAGDQLDKKMTVRPIRGEYEYVDMVAYFYSPCQFDFGTDLDFQKDIFAVDTISVYFIPACPVAQVIAPSSNWVINKASGNVLTCEIQENNFFFDNHRKIKLQFKPAYGSDLDWVDIEIWSRDSIEVEQNDWQYFPIGNNYIVYDWDITPYDLTNGDYDVRWYFICEDGTESQSSISKGVIDKQSPYPFGAPQPADGVLSPGDEVLLKFNESIEIGKISQDNIIVEGRLNGEGLQHGTSTAYSSTGKDSTFIQDLNLLGNAFTMELWLNRTSSSGPQRILSHGLGEETFFSLDIGSNGRLLFSMNDNNSVESIHSIPLNDWTHVAFSFDPETDEVSLYINGQRTAFTSSFTEIYLGQGDLVLGGKHGGKSPFTGYIHDLRVWKKEKSEIEIASNFNNKLTGKEVNLLGYWPMDEGQGASLIDKAQDRDAVFNGTWQLLPESMSLKTNGSYLEYAGTVAYTDEADFTIAFWFKGNQPNQTSTLFSNGRGETAQGDSTWGNADSWAIKALPTGQIRVYNNGLVFNATDSNFFDNKWHHFALVVNRNGYTSAIIDGQLNKAEYGMTWSGFGGPAVNLGARVYYDSLTNKIVDEHFNGSFDELRIWGLARKQQQIERDMNKRLRNDKKGLDVYLPFEDYDSYLRTVVPHSGNIVEGKDSLFAQLNGTQIVAESPTIKSDPYPVPVHFNFSANGDQILIDLSVNDPAKIENTILDFTVSNIYDKNGNRMVSPVTWSAYIDLNQVVWDRREETLRKKVGEELSFEAYIQNEGGTIQDFELHDLPEWLIAIPSEGELSPKSVQKVTFYIHKDVPKGKYSEPIYLKANEGFNEVLNLNLEVFQPLPKQFNFNPADYTDSMTVIGQLEINGFLTNDPNDLLIATVNNTIRGRTSLDYISQYDKLFAKLTVYSNVKQGEEVSFKIWDADEGIIYDLPDVIFQGNTSKTIDFQSGSVLGSYSEPITFRTTGEVMHSLSIPSGWSWVSFNGISTKLERSSSLFNSVINNEGDLITDGLGRFDLYTKASNKWYGNLAGDNLSDKETGLDIGWGYKIFANSPKVINYSGPLADPTTVSIPIKANEWTWIGFVGGTKMKINEALSGLDATEGDMIKAQTQFAVYDANLGWVGSLEYLEPHTGYMIHCAKDNELSFPKYASLSGYSITKKALPPVDGLEDFSPDRYGNNMTVIAKVMDMESYVLSSGGALVAYKGDEIVGVATESQLENGLFFLTISGKESTNISFKLYDSEGNPYVIQEEIRFVANQRTGTLSAPMELHIGHPKSSVKVVPNPFNDAFTIELGEDRTGDVVITLITTNGQTVFIRSEDAGKSAITIDPSGASLSTGVYYLNLRFENETITQKLLKQ